MLAQWVPLHAVSCSNLIETGGSAESREIPLRVTQTGRALLFFFFFFFLFFFFVNSLVRYLSCTWFAFNGDRSLVGDSLVSYTPTRLLSSALSNTHEAFKHR